MAKRPKQTKPPEPREESPESIHDSDCAIYNEPAYPAGPCDCVVSEPASPAEPTFNRAAALTMGQGASSKD